MTGTSIAQYLDGSVREVVSRIPTRASRLVLLFVLSHLVAYFLQLGVVAQLPTALLLYFLCPGLLIPDLLDVKDTASRVALVVASSLGCNVVLVTLLLYLGVYSPTNGVLLVSSVSVVLSLVASTREQVENQEIEVAGDV
jgi:hypothetical protein